MLKNYLLWHGRDQSQLARPQQGHPVLEGPLPHHLTRLQFHQLFDWYYTKYLVDCTEWAWFRSKTLIKIIYILLEVGQNSKNVQGQNLFIFKRIRKDNRDIRNILRHPKRTIKREVLWCIFQFYCWFHSNSWWYMSKARNIY